MKLYESDGCYAMMTRGAVLKHQAKLQMAASGKRFPFIRKAAMIGFWEKHWRAYNQVLSEALIHH